MSAKKSNNLRAVPTEPAFIKFTEEDEERLSEIARFLRGLTVAFGPDVAGNKIERIDVHNIVKPAMERAYDFSVEVWERFATVRKVGK